MIKKWIRTHKKLTWLFIVWITFFSIALTPHLLLSQSTLRTIFDVTFLGLGILLFDISLYLID